MNFISKSLKITDSFNIFQKSKRQVFKLAIFQVVSPEFGFVNLDPALFWICSDVVMLHIHRNDTVGQFNPEAVLKRWDSSGNRKIHPPITDCHLKLFIKLLL
jgi:hypothetical protein